MSHRKLEMGRERAGAADELVESQGPVSRGGAVTVEMMTEGGSPNEHVSWKAQRSSRRGDGGELESALVTSQRVESVDGGLGARLQSSE